MHRQQPQTAKKERETPLVYTGVPSCSLLYIHTCNFLHVHNYFSTTLYSHMTVTTKLSTEQVSDTIEQPT